MINTVLEMTGDVNSRMHNKLSPMHCAAQTYHGLLSLVIMTKRYNVKSTVIDVMQATPLHFAAMYHEYKNVEYLISSGADLNAQDVQGHTPIHICLIRLIQDPEKFTEYKRIIKTLLFAGASREVKTNQKLTALDLLQ